MRDDDDDHWIDALAGRVPQAGTGRAPLDDAHALRRAILDRPAAAAAPVPVEDPAREDALIAKARAAHVLPASASPVPAARATWYSGRRARFAAAAAVLCIAAGVEVQIRMRTQPPAPILRGDAAGVAHLVAADPLALKKELIRELEAVGVHATGYANLGRQGVDADLPSPLPAEVRAVLERHGIPVPRDQALQVEIEPMSQP